jgi:gamma-glutamylcyclotransferase (GGCT)/AIG2-like uncharacterized protein YtfP
MSDYLFAYGTLQPGHAPASIAEAAAKLRPVCRGFIYGEIYKRDGYPGAVLDPQSKNKIPGTVLELPDDPDLLRQLDYYEGYDPASPETSEFVRVRQTAELENGGTLECWFYRYSPDAKT